ncbi:MAG: glycosyltransferase, partial [Pyrinomonadaceae bacterium]|nr:glycosyltransferase [Pyrinomonadaceae bacterium]
MKVLQILNSFNQGGSERQAVQLVRLLREDATHEIFVACLNKSGVLRDEITGFDAIPEFRLTSFYNAQFLIQARECAKFIARNKIEIVQTHDFYTNVFGILAAKIAGVKIKIAAKRETENMRSKAQKIIEKQAFRLSKAIVANAEAVKSYLIKEGVKPNKNNVIYNGLDLERLKPSTA